MPLPTFNQVRQVAFSPERYGKQSTCANASRGVVLGGTRGKVVEDNDDENGPEVYGYLKLAQRSAPERLDGALEHITSLPVDVLYEVCRVYVAVHATFHGLQCQTKDFTAVVSLPMILSAAMLLKF